MTDTVESLRAQLAEVTADRDKLAQKLWQVALGKDNGAKEVADRVLGSGIVSHALSNAVERMSAHMFNVLRGSIAPHPQSPFGRGEGFVKPKSRHETVSVELLDDLAKGSLILGVEIENFRASYEFSRDYANAFKELDKQLGGNLVSARLHSTQLMSPIQATPRHYRSLARPGDLVTLDPAAFDSFLKYVEKKGP